MDIDGLKVAPPFLLVKPFVTEEEFYRDATVREERRHLLTRTRLEGPADFVIEIASDSDPRLDVREKLPRYREAGIEEIWLINPFEQIILAEVKEPSGYASRRLTAGRLTSRVVPGCWIDIGWLWRDPLPSTLVCLREILGAS